MTVWEPTHHVGHEPIPVWSTPDPSQPPTAELGAGLPVYVAERRGAWVEVVATNGFRGWVDGGRLVPITISAPTPAPPKRSRAVWIVLGAIAVIAVAAVVVLTRGDSKKATTDVAAPSPTASTLVRFTVPTGWSVSDDGLTIAEQEADLTASTPSGPRITAVVGAVDDDPNAFVRDALSGTSFDIIETPTDTDVSRVPAIRLTIRKDNVILRFIGAHPKGKDGVVFTVECPVERFEEVQGALEAAPGLSP
ncbi:MAG: hypothetical protein QOI95_4258 [Acidimicrobiaceae bacterium]